MTRPQAFGTTISAALFMILLGFVTNSVSELERATIAQCASHDWPAQSHDIHMEWCADNGYATK